MAETTTTTMTTDTTTMTNADTMERKENTMTETTIMTTEPIDTKEATINTIESLRALSLYGLKKAADEKQAALAMIDKRDELFNDETFANLAKNNINFNLSVKDKKELSALIVDYIAWVSTCNQYADTIYYYKKSVEVYTERANYLFHEHITIKENPQSFATQEAYTLAVKKSETNYFSASESLHNYENSYNAIKREGKELFAHEFPFVKIMIEALNLSYDTYSVSNGNFEQCAVMIATFTGLPYTLCLETMKLVSYRTIGKKNLLNGNTIVPFKAWTKGIYRERFLQFLAQLLISSKNISAQNIKKAVHNRLS